MRFGLHLQNLFRTLIENRLLLSLGMSAACGIVLQSLYPINDTNPMLRFIALEKPGIFHALSWGYNLFLYTTPFIAVSILLSLAYVHFYAPDMNTTEGPLPPYPDPGSRRELFLVAGELHHQLRPEASRCPRWMSIPERGLSTGIFVVGAIGSGKTQAVILPAMRQLFAYRANDPIRKLSGIVLEVKGDLCRQTEKDTEFVWAARRLCRGVARWRSPL